MNILSRIKKSITELLLFFDLLIIIIRKTFIKCFSKKYRILHKTTGYKKEYTVEYKTLISRKWKVLRITKTLTDAEYAIELHKSFRRLEKKRGKT